MNEASELAQTAADSLRTAIGVQSYDAVVVLGSGWTGAAAAFGEVLGEVGVAELPGFHPPLADGHAGLVRAYRVGSRSVLAFLGRTHLYEGHGAAAVAHPIRTAAALGARLAVLTNANGSLRPEWNTGMGVVISDHLNPTFATPLVGSEFVDLADAWSPRLRTAVLDAFPDLAEGVYVMLPGPQYQTLAETKMLRVLGADIVGMSTVVEALAARALGLELFGLSVVTVREGMGDVIDPDEVVAQAAAAADRLGAVLAWVLNQ